MTWAFAYDNRNPAHLGGADGDLGETCRCREPTCMMRWRKRVEKDVWTQTSGSYDDDAFAYDGDGDTGRPHLRQCLADALTCVGAKCLGGCWRGGERRNGRLDADEITWDRCGMSWTARERRSTRVLPMMATATSAESTMPANRRNYKPFGYRVDLETGWLLVTDQVPRGITIPSRDAGCKWTQSDSTGRIAISIGMSATTRWGLKTHLHWPHHQHLGCSHSRAADR